MKLPVNRTLPLAAFVLLVACSGGAHVRDVPQPANGPAADYPIVLGPSYAVDGVTYTPADTLSYDAVGYAATSVEGGGAVSASHRTLPLPSYVEVTALNTGKTILVRLERRGPMTGELLSELSPGAATQLGIAGQSRVPVRVRRVNPPEVDRAMLRSGQQAPARMETPKSLLAVLMRKLDQQNGVSGVSNPEPVTTPAATETPVVKPKPKVEPKPKAKSAVAGGLVVQIAAFSSKEKAETTATKAGASVSAAGSLWRVRMGPFATQAEANAALVRARAAGYSDARIQRAN